MLEQQLAAEQAKSIQVTRHLSRNVSLTRRTSYVTRDTCYAMDFACPEQLIHRTLALILCNSWRRRLQSVKLIVPRGERRFVLRFL